MLYTNSAIVSLFIEYALDINNFSLFRLKK